jgi:hypothetical protein
VFTFLAYAFSSAAFSAFFSSSFTPSATGLYLEAPALSLA